MARGPGVQRVYDPERSIGSHALLTSHARPNIEATHVVEVMDGMNERKGGFVVSQSIFYGNLIDVQGIKVSVFAIVFTTPLGAAVDSWQLPRSCFNCGLSGTLQVFYFLR